MNNWDNMSNEELCAEYQQTRNDELFNYFIERNSRLMLYRLRYKLNKNPENSDIITNFARTAMWKAMLTFDVDGDIKFSTWYIANYRGELRDYNEDEMFSLHIPEYRLFKDDLNFNILCQDSLYTQQSTNSENSYSIEDTIADDSESLEDMVVRKDIVNVVKDTVCELRPRERYIIDQRFGLTDGVNRTLREIAKDLNLSHERVRQLEKKALKKLQILLKNKI